MTFTGSQLNAFYTLDSFIIELDCDKRSRKQEDTELKEWMEHFSENKYKTLFRFGFLAKKEWFSPQMEYLYHIADSLIQKLSKQPDLEISRENVVVDLTEDELEDMQNKLPFAIGMEYVDREWLQRLWSRLIRVFRSEISEYDGSVAAYLTERNSNINIAGRVFFHMVENKDDTYPFAFLATYSSKPVKSKKAIHTPLKNALEEYKEDEKKLLSLLSTVTKAAEKSDFISGLIESGELFLPIKLSVKEAYIFLNEIPLYEEAGIMCRVPDWWRKKTNSIRITISVGEKEPAKVGLDAIMDFSPALMVGEEILTEAELKKFLSMAEGLLQYKGKWVEINKSKLEKALQSFNKAKLIAKTKQLSLSEAMRLELNYSKLLDIGEEDMPVSITNGQWLKNIKENLNNPKKFAELELVPSFRATLRPYQNSGYQWLYQTTGLGFGVCLADDMGLGKTVQIIAFLEYIRVHKGGKALLIIPASLIGNWQKEIEKFAPELTFQILHKSAGSSSEDIALDDRKFLYITTYGMAVRLEELHNTHWEYLILDEAQAIKNPGTKQTKQIKKIPARIKIAMTGTPIENRLSDLWSLFDFLNSGLLGTAKEFTNITKNISGHSMGYAKLKKIISPFILRRLKTDKNIIADLPEKIEINEFTSLTKKQIMLYQSLVAQIENKLGEAEGIERKGLVLASILKLKQICNHPDQYLGREEYKPEYSGKFEQLREICKTIYEKHERVLIFTQFREMTEPLSDYLKAIFQREGLVLHGGTSVKERNRMVEQFNGEAYIPYMVLSLKAGGVGLNLTAANHVVHFDRWWNPAVENQATDRAFRIGQLKNVLVHKFVTKGTIEEKIDAMINDKQKLSGDILGSTGEQWITELSNEELIKLFTLGAE